ncbi:MAG: RibD family protein [Gammaproteobacteria bacterium]
MNLNRQIERWLTSRKTTFESRHRPFITLAYAQSWDGSITNRCGETLPLSGTESTRLTHQLRSLHDGILVGIGTVLSDDPQLTVREWHGPNPQPIVLDSRLRMPQTAQLCHHPDKQCWILTTHSDTGKLGNKVEVISINAAEQEHVPLKEAMKMLWEKGIGSLMVEGGATIITAFLKARMADVLVLTIAPRLIGGYRAVGDLATTTIADLPKIDPLYSKQIGQDLIVWGNIHYGGSLA